MKTKQHPLVCVIVFFSHHLLLFASLAFACSSLMPVCWQTLEVYLLSKQFLQFLPCGFNINNVNRHWKYVGIQIEIDAADFWHTKNQAGIEKKVILYIFLFFSFSLVVIHENPLFFTKIFEYFRLFRNTM